MPAPWSGCPNGRWHICYSQPGPGEQPGDWYTAPGRLSAELVSELAIPRHADVYLCGPAVFMAQFLAGLVALGFEPSRIHTETFGAVAAVTPGIAAASGTPVHPPAGRPGPGPAVSFPRSSLTVNWGPDHGALLDLAEACDVPTRCSCRTGVCHTCETPMLSGSGPTAACPETTQLRRPRPGVGEQPIPQANRRRCASPEVAVTPASERGPGYCSPQMLTTLGGTGLAASRIGLGLAALGRPDYINLGHASDLAGRTEVEPLELLAHAVLDAAYARGVRYFDAARSYGQAEAFLAEWLERRGLGPDEVTVGSKWGYTYTADWRVDAPVHEVKDLSLATLRRQLAESRELLGPNLRLYQIHSATLDSGVLDDRAVLEELARLRAGGVSIGLTVTGPRQAETIERALEVGGFDVVQATWNLLERAAGSALAAAHAAGMGVIVKEPLANGRLSARGADAELANAARCAGSTPDALALAVVLAQSWADVALSGAATVKELESNLAALELELDPQLVERLDAIHQDPVRYWQTRAALLWN